MWIRTRRTDARRLVGVGLRQLHVHLPHPLLVGAFGGKGEEGEEKRLKIDILEGGEAERRRQRGDACVEETVVRRERRGGIQGGFKSGFLQNSTERMTPRAARSPELTPHDQRTGASASSVVFAVFWPRGA